MKLTVNHIKGVICGLHEKIKLKEPEQVEKQEVVTWSEDIWGMFVDKSKYKNDDTLSSHSKMMAYIYRLVASDLVNPKEQTKSVAQSLILQGAQVNALIALQMAMSQVTISNGASSVTRSLYSEQVKEFYNKNR